MGPSRLSSAQLAILSALADFDPRWTLTGGAALAGFHLGHRATRDLDIFWHGRSTLEDFEPAVEATLRAAGFTVRALRRTPSFVRLRVEADDGEAVEVDLVAEPVPHGETPALHPLGDRVIEVDTPGEILANKLAALLSRSELRDLVDVDALLATGLDLPSAVEAAGQKDGAMSAATLAWVLSQLPVGAIGAREGWPDAGVQRLASFRDHLCAQLAKLSIPR